MRNDYTYTDKQNPHALRSREMLKKYPQIKEWMKPYPMTALWITLVTLTQLVTAYAVVHFDLNGWWIFALSYTIGALASHALFVLLHEACHDAIFKKKIWNKWWGIFCNIGQGFPSAMSFRTFHLLHHAHLNEYDNDADLAFNWEARLVKNIWWRKVLWFLAFFLIESIRPSRLKKGKTFEMWSLINIAFIIGTNVAIYFFIGPWALGYIILSSLFSVGLHPVGARWVQEHYTYQEGQETYGYYGILNKFQFNIGYHNEHHDFYRVPWIHLPKIKALAPEYYDNLFSHKSWTLLLLDFIFNPERDLYLRIVRERDNKSRKNDEQSTQGAGSQPSFAK